MTDINFNEKLVKYEKKNFIFEIRLFFMDSLKKKKLNEIIFHGRMEWYKRQDTRYINFLHLHFFIFLNKSY